MYETNVYFEERLMDEIDRFSTQWLRSSAGIKSIALALQR